MLKCPSVLLNKVREEGGGTSGIDLEQQVKTLFRDTLMNF
jgi:hypothetical protein